MIEDVADARDIPYAFTYEVPEEFVRLPEPTASDGWQEAMATLLPETDENQRLSASAQIRSQLSRVSAEELTILNALCVGTEEVDGDERLSMGLLAVSVRASGHDDGLLAGEGIYRAKERSLFAGQRGLLELDFDLGKGWQGPQDMLLAVKLPCGPAVMSTSLRSLQLPAQEGGSVPAPLPVASLQLIVPAPCAYCVYVTIATPSVFLLDSYCTRLAHIGRTLTFEVGAEG
ncbi:hypothetical protein JJV70_03480 [Streptomyces sp. JJ66]|uniref:hypothetical protein n=1 Tax=Streptomyces sp. JJ66 TaxID=2803843 RepID=UPI001C57A905|nr:hypothetical protein [Streptomyces sp. JJ66]MBW1601178.1 hypothetical protein [Streptomyces sp. JJ66]